MTRGKYTHGGSKRTGNNKGASISHYAKGHRPAITGHPLKPTAVHGHGRAT